MNVAQANEARRQLGQARLMRWGAHNWSLVDGTLRVDLKPKINRTYRLVVDLDPSDTYTLNLWLLGGKKRPWEAVRATPSRTFIYGDRIGLTMEEMCKEVAR